MNGLRFYVLLNSISVISTRCEDDKLKAARTVENGEQDSASTTELTGLLSLSLTLSLSLSLSLSLNLIVSLVSFPIVFIVLFVYIVHCKVGLKKE